jgi:multidrug resistance efflux pump
MMSRRWIVIMLLLAVCTGCERMMGDRTKFSGTLELDEHAIGAKASGRLSTMTVDEGSEVKKGQLLATLDRYEQAKKDFDRTSALFKEGGVNQQTLEYAQLALEDQEIVSPVDGVILVRVHDLGEVVTAGAPVVVVGDRAKYWVKIFVPEGIVNRLNMNDPAQINLDGVRESFNGHISFIASKAEFTPRNIQTTEERVTQTFAVKVTIDNPPANLRPGVACDVKINL